MDVAPYDTQPIEAEELSAWAVLTGGTHVRMDFVGTDRAPRHIILPFDLLGSLLMTLPRMLQTALDARSADGSLRFVQRLGTWQIEQAAANSGLILRLGTPDGFEVAFALNDRDTEELSAALRAVPETDPSNMRRPN